MGIKVGGLTMSKSIRRALLVAFSLAVVCGLMTLPAYADDWDKATKITVNRPFEIPGTILPAGTYWVKLVDLAGERHVVRILSEDESRVLATLIAIPDFRLETTDKTEITFYEAEAGTPPPLHAWFYPGHQFGVEFAYPEKRAAAIAAKAEEHVIATKEPEPESEPAFTWEPEPAVPKLLEEPLVAVEPSGREVELAEVHPEVALEVASPLPPELPALPKTATPFPLVALLGFAAAGAASSLQRLRK
jgi:hypothetical protein